MKRRGFCVALLLSLASLISAQAPPSRHAKANPTPQTFQKYCFECHGTHKPEAGLSIEKLTGHASIAADWQDWEKVADMLESGMMPPHEAEQPDGRRARGGGGVDPRVGR